MLWFRMYSEFAFDPKVQSMPEEMQRRLVMLFCLQSDGSYSKLTPEEVAFQLRIPIETLHETFHLFQTKGFLDEQHQICAWNERQYMSDSSTERVRKFREKSKAKKNETLRNVSVTPPDTDTDTELKEKNTKKEKVEIPDWIPQQEWNDYLEMRKKIRKPMTTQAVKLAIGELQKLREQGQPPAEVLRQSVFNSWQGLFALKQAQRPAGSRMPAGVGG